MKKAVNPKTNCFVYMDMKFSNWNLLFQQLNSYLLALE